MDRYDGKPFLRLLECYVLSSIGQLHEHEQEILQKMEPKLAGVYNLNGTWLDIVRNQMGFPESLPQKIREAWDSNLAKAQERGSSVDPNEFAMAFIDQNLPNIALQTIEGK